MDHKYLRLLLTRSSNSLEGQGSGLYRSFSHAAILDRRPGTCSQPIVEPFRKGCIRDP